MEEKLFKDELETQIKDALSVMKEEVKIVLYKSDDEGSKLTEKLLTELKELSNNKIILELKDYNKDDPDNKKYNIKGVPSYIFLDKDNNYLNLTYSGIPAGHEINTLIVNLMDISKYTEKFFEDKDLEKIKNINKKTNIKVFVTLGCPHCPGAAINASRLALLNNNITTEIFESQSFGNEAVKYNVSSVPKIVINESNEFVGNQPIQVFLDNIL